MVGEHLIRSSRLTPVVRVSRVVTGHLSSFNVRSYSVTTELGTVLTLLRRSSDDGTEGADLDGEDDAVNGAPDRPREQDEADETRIRAKRVGEVETN